MLFEVLIDSNLRFCSQVLTLSFTVRLLYENENRVEWEWAGNVNENGNGISMFTWQK